MHKFFITLGNVLFFTNTLWAQMFPAPEQPQMPLCKEMLCFQLQSRLEQAAATRHTNKDAIKNNFRVFFHIQETLFNIKRNKDVGTYEGYLLCKAYALDEHWLILPSSCMDYLNPELSLSELPANWVRRDIKITGISDFAAPLNLKHRNGRIMLLHTYQKQNGPYVNILATNSPERLANLSSEKGHSLKIHTNRLGTDSVRLCTINTNSIKNNTFNLNGHALDLSGVARDPLFIVSPEGNAFLAGYNNGEFKGHFDRIRYDLDLIRIYNGRASEKWYSLTEEDLHFIKNEVSQTSEEDWRRIQQRLFFNQINAPYFEP